MDYSVLVYRIDHFSGSFGRPIKQLICHGDDMDEVSIEKDFFDQMDSHDLYILVEFHQSAQGVTYIRT